MDKSYAAIRDELVMTLAANGFGEKAAAIVDALEKLIEARIEMTRGRSQVDRGKKKNLGANGTKVKRAPRAADKIGAFVGVSGRTVEKIAAVLAAAERDPEKYGQFVQHMDETGAPGYSSLCSILTATRSPFHQSRFSAASNKRRARINASCQLRAGLRSIGPRMSDDNVAVNPRPIAVKSILP
jgi:hypothetical protein